MWWFTGVGSKFFYKRGGLATVGVPRKSHTGSRGNALVGDLEDEAGTHVKLVYTICNDFLHKI